MAKPTIFIPGFPASELHDKNTGEKLFPPPLGNIGGALQKLIQVPGDVVAGPPILDKIPIIAPAASTLYAILNGYGISQGNGNFTPIGWDWRLSVASDDTVARIKKAVDDLTPQGKIVAVIHSTGGLVLRAFLQKRPDYVERFEQVLALAIPWLGTLEALHAVDKGSEVAIGPIKLLTAGASKDLLTRAQAAYDLFPSDPATSLFFSGNNPSTPLADRTWLDPARPYMNDRCNDACPQSNTFPDLPVTNLCGWGGDTWPRCDSANGSLTFGNPDNEFGDGTVQFVSASSLQGNGVRSMFLPIGAYAEGLIPQYHGQVWEPKAVRQIFDEVFDDAPRKPFVIAAADKDKYVDPESPVLIRIAANAADGTPLPDAKVSFRNGARIETPSFDGGKKMDLILSRAVFVPVTATSSLRRTEITVSWDGGSKKIPLLIQT
jgi:pimeloyl-ACP methyl ester carboxylesterase